MQDSINECLRKERGAKEHEREDCACWRQSNKSPMVTSASMWVRIYDPAEEGVIRVLGLPSLNLQHIFH